MPKGIKEDMQEHLSHPFQENHPACKACRSHKSGYSISLASHTDYYLFGKYMFV